MRSTWKGPVINRKIFKIIKKKNKKFIINRDATILPSFIGFQFKVHNGFKQNIVRILPIFIGDKFGMYSLTRKKNLNKYKKKWGKK